MAGVSVAASPPAKSKAPPARRLPPEPPGIVPQVILNGVGPMEWNAAVGRGRGSGPSAPDWPALRVLQPLGGESLYVFRERTFTPMLVASWPRQDVAAHSVRIFPNYRWIAVSSAADSAVRFYGLDGSVHWEARWDAMPVGLGRDLILTRRPSRMSVTSVESGKSRVAAREFPRGEHDWDCRYRLGAAAGRAAPPGPGGDDSLGAHADRRSASVRGQQLRRRGDRA